MLLHPGFGASGDPRFVGVAIAYGGSHRCRTLQNSSADGPSPRLSGVRLTEPHSAASCSSGRPLGKSRPTGTPRQPLLLVAKSQKPFKKAREPLPIDRTGASVPQAKKPEPTVCGWLLKRRICAPRKKSRFYLCGDKPLGTERPRTTSGPDLADFLWPESSVGQITNRAVKMNSDVRAYCNR